MFGHPLLWLVIATMIIVLAWAVWSLSSTLRRHRHGPNVSGVGGPNDPMS